MYDICTDMHFTIFNLEHKLIRVLIFCVLQQNVIDFACLTLVPDEAEVIKNGSFVL